MLRPSFSGGKRSGILLDCKSFESGEHSRNKAKLQRILTYHVVSGKVTSADVAQLRSAKTVSNDTLMIAAGNGGVMVDIAHVVKADIPATNGVIHVIDSVILPKGE